MVVRMCPGRAVEVASQLRRVVASHLVWFVTTAACCDRTKILSTHVLTSNFGALRKPGSAGKFKEKLTLINQVLK